MSLDIDRLIQSLNVRTLEFFSPDWIEKNVAERMEMLGVNTIEQYERLMKQNEDENNCLISKMYNGYSIFFRDSFSLSVLENIVIHDLVNSKKENMDLRMWSVGCSCGQEPYSILILIKDTLRQSGFNRKIKMFATDVSSDALICAREGVYKREDLERVPFGLVERHFSRVENIYRINSDIKECVSFSFFDILDDRLSAPPESIYGHFDLIICCNLLIYYNNQTQGLIIEKLINALSPNGYLIVGEVEKGLLATYKAVKAVVSSGTIFKKCD